MMCRPDVDFGKTTTGEGQGVGLEARPQRGSSGAQFERRWDQT